MSDYWILSFQRKVSPRFSRIIAILGTFCSLAALQNDEFFAIFEYETRNIRNQGDAIITIENGHSQYLICASPDAQ